MPPSAGKLLALGAALTWIGLAARAAAETIPVPDRLVVLTFDDGNLTDLTYVAPLLSRYGFRATFFITEAFQPDRQNYMTWDEIRRLSKAGFEIGNHTRSHPDCRNLSKQQFRAEVEAIEERCRQHGVPAPRTFCYPGYEISRNAAEVLAEKGYLFARRGCEPVSAFLQYDFGGRGPAYDPRRDHPLAVPATGASGPNWSLADLDWAVRQARDGKVAVLTFHGVPDCHFWCSTDPARLAACLKRLHDERCTVVALGDLAKYVDRSQAPRDPLAPIERQLRLAPGELTCEYLANPLGIDVARPRFSWKSVAGGRGQSQSAYQIVVAGSEEELRRDRGDLWDSGKVVSGESVNIPYAGKPLESGQQCWWKVRCWNRPSEDLVGALRMTLDAALLEQVRSEAVGPDSPRATFEIGLLAKEDWQGRWIAAEKGISAPLLRKQFEIAGPVKRARAYVAGLGYYELYLNGQKVGDRVLEPASTLYDNARLPELHSRVLYATYDVTDRLQAGTNAVGVILGNGWFSADKKRGMRIPYGERPTLLLQIQVEMADGTKRLIPTDTTWKTVASPVLANELCHGETYDARLEKPGWDAPGYDDSGWRPADLAQPPNGVLRAQMIPPVQVVQRIPAVKLLQPRESPGPSPLPAGEGTRYVFDFGQHFSGWTRLRVRGPRGTAVTLKYAGQIDDDDRLDRRNNSSAEQTDRYILKGQGLELWEPRFTCHGFRYVEVSGLPGPPALEDLEGCFVRSAIRPVGTFACSNPLLNQIHHNVCWTLMTSFQGIPQDAAERDERVGWLGDPGFMADSYFLNYDTAGFWSKWLNDIRDSQKLDGDVPVISPPHFGGGYSFMPAWKSSYPLFVWDVYQYHGDRRVLEEHYEGLKKLVEFLRGKAVEHIISQGLGDHMEPQPEGYCNFSPRHTPAALTSTAYYYRDVWILARAAELLGKAEDAGQYSRLAEAIRAAYHRKFFDPATNQYGSGSQTSNALSLHLGLVPADRRAAVARNVADDVLLRHEGHLSTGIIGTNALQQVLPDYGFSDVMFRIASRTTFPSWGYQIRNGATTVWETFDLNPTRCLNMKMFCSTEKFFYMDLAGLAPAAPGWEKIVVRPRVCGDLTWARASIDTPHGLASVDWRKEGDSLCLAVVVPVSVTATIHVPTLGLTEVAVTENGKPCWAEGKLIGRTCGITAGRQSGDAVMLDAGSGRYLLRLAGTPARNLAERRAER
jgi:alpha-L-rhamnosidase